MQLQLHRPQPKGRGGRRTDLPRAMSAAAIDHFGGPEVLTLHVLPVPAVDAEEVLIALDTAGVGTGSAQLRNIQSRTRWWARTSRPGAPRIRSGLASSS